MISIRATEFHNRQETHCTSWLSPRTSTHTEHQNTQLQITYQKHHQDLPPLQLLLQTCTGWLVRWWAIISSTQKFISWKILLNEISLKYVVLVKSQLDRKPVPISGIHRVLFWTDVENHETDLPIDKLANCQGPHRWKYHWDQWSVPACILFQRYTHNPYTDSFYMTVADLGFPTQILPLLSSV